MQTGGDRPGGTRARRAQGLDSVGSQASLPEVGDLLQGAEVE